MQKNNACKDLSNNNDKEELEKDSIEKDSPSNSRIDSKFLCKKAWNDKELMDLLMS